MRTLSAGLNQLLGWLWIARVPTSAIAVMLYLIPIDEVGSSRSILGAIAVFVLVAATFICNDLIDYKIDLINCPYRPLPSGRVSVRAARAVTGAIIAPLLIILSLLGTCAVVYGIGFYVVLVLYALKWKRVPIVKNVGIAAVYTSLLYFGEIIGVGEGGGEYAILCFLFLLAREIRMDIRDDEGDGRQSVWTISIVVGWRTASLVCSGLLAGCMYLSLVRMQEFQTPYSFLLLVPHMLLAVSPIVQRTYSRMFILVSTEIEKYALAGIVLFLLIDE